jgi:hypothetical protein
MTHTVTDKSVVIMWDGLNVEERECHELDDDVKILGTLESTCLLVEHEDW